MLTGSYDVTLLGPSADDVIFSVTWSDGFLDDYVTFELPEVTDPLTDEEFDAVAIKPELEFDHGLPGSEPNEPEIELTTTPSFDDSWSTEEYNETQYNGSYLIMR